MDAHASVANVRREPPPLFPIRRTLMMTFDYTASAELFMPKRKGGPRPQLSYRRFATAAEAIRFAVEELPSVRMLGAWMQVGEERFNRLRKSG